MNFPYGKNILITGASSGIGLAAAKRFAQAGYTVYALSRKCGEGACGNIVNIRADVCDEASIVRARERIGDIGVILHCAGMGIAGAAEDTPEEAVRRQFEVNYFGVLRVNRVFLPGMRARGGGLVLVISSVAGRVPLPYQSHYSATKYALDTYVESLRMESRRFGIRAALIEPGDTRTGFTAMREMAIPTSAELGDSPYRAACEGAVARMARDEQNGAPPERAAQAALKLAGKTNPPVRVTVGLPYKLIMLLRRLLPARLFESVLEKMYR